MNKRSVIFGHHKIKDHNFENDTNWYQQLLVIQLILKLVIRFYFNIMLSENVLISFLNPRNSFVLLVVMSSNNWLLGVIFPPIDAWMNDFFLSMFDLISLMGFFLLEGLYTCF